MNVMKTAMLLAALTALFMGVGFLIGGSGGAFIAFLVAAGMNLFSYWNSDRMVLRMHNAQEVDERSAPDLYRMIAGLAARAGLPMPKIYLIDDQQPNAFATGRNPQNAAVAVTRGLLQQLSPDEVAGVMAHELAHVKNRDTLTMTITATIAGAISMLANFAFFFGGSRENNSPFGFIGVLLAAITAPIAAMLVQMAISRTREYSADRLGAEISGKPLALASALAKISRLAGRMPMATAERNPATAPLFIVNPLTGERMDNLFSTHPATENRIAALQELAQQPGSGFGGAETSRPRRRFGCGRRLGDALVACRPSRRARPVGLSGRAKANPGKARKNPPGEVPGLAVRRTAASILNQVYLRGVPLDALTDEAHGLAHFRALPARDRALTRAIATTALRRRGEIDAALARCLDRPLPPGSDALYRHPACRGRADPLPRRARPCRRRPCGDAGGRRAERPQRARPRQQRAAAARPRAERDLSGARTRGSIRRAGSSSAGAPITARRPRSKSPRRIWSSRGSTFRRSASRKSGRNGWKARCCRPARSASRRGGASRRCRAMRRAPGGCRTPPPRFPRASSGTSPAGSVADLCAAPGGKTAELAAAGALVTAVDISANRLKRLAANLKRLDLAADLVTADVLAWEPGRSFDAVLLDAPCSSTGTIRRHPDVAWLKRPEDIAALSALQARLLDRAAGLVAPGGALVFCTCSLEPEEGEDHVAPFLARHPDYSLRTHRAGGNRRSRASGHAARHAPHAAFPRFRRGLAGPRHGRLLRGSFPAGVRGDKTAAYGRELFGEAASGCPPSRLPDAVDHSSDCEGLAGAADWLLLIFP